LGWGLAAQRTRFVQRGKVFFPICLIVTSRGDRASLEIVGMNLTGRNGHLLRKC
jgi:hypothetical protein